MTTFIFVCLFAAAEARQEENEWKTMRHSWKLLSECPLDRKETLTHVFESSLVQNMLVDETWKVDLEKKYCKFTHYNSPVLWPQWLFLTFLAIPEWTNNNEPTAKAELLQVTGKHCSLI